MYIGFRTYRYGPTSTSNRGGSNGAGVPRPERVKVKMHQRASRAPVAPTITPANCATPMFSGRTMPDHDRTRLGRKTSMKPINPVAYTIVRIRTNIRPTDRNSRLQLFAHLPFDR